MKGFLICRGDARLAYETDLGYWINCTDRFWKTHNLKEGPTTLPGKTLSARFSKLLMASIVTIIRWRKHHPEPGYDIPGHGTLNMDPYGRIEQHRWDLKICTPPCGDRPFNKQLNEKMGRGNVSYRDLWRGRCRAVLGLEKKLQKRLKDRSTTAITFTIQASPTKNQNKKNFKEYLINQALQEAEAASLSPVHEGKDVHPSPPRDATDPPSMLNVLKQLNVIRRMEKQQQQQQQQELLKYVGAIT